MTANLSGSPLSRCPLRAQFSCFGLILILLVATADSGRGQAPTPPPATGGPPAEGLRLADFVTRVLAQNQNLQIRMLDFEISRRRHASERGAFEPDFVASFSHEINRRENTAEQSSAQFGRSIFSETNDIYNGGLESLVPSGARVRLGYTLRDLNNSLQTGIRSTNGEYQTFFGATVTQPLLKNFGFSATMVGIRVAALNSEVAFQEYRRQLMLLVSTAEAAYWNLFMAQEQVHWLNESVALAETILRDNRARIDAGRGSELEVLEAQAGVALRRVKLEEARQHLQEAMSQVVSLFQSSTVLFNGQLVVVDPPEAIPFSASLMESWRTARDQNPDYLAQMKRYGMENVRLAYARNQRLPQLDLKGSYGLNGLGTTPGESWDDVQRQGFPSWSIGVELRIPIGGGTRARNDLAAARLSEEKALRTLRDTENQIVNAIDTALKKAASRRDSIQSYQTIVTFSQNLLDTQLERLKVGRVESRKVLEVEADLLQARQGVTEAQVQYRRALLEKELVEGSVLQNRNLELTQSELENQTRRLTRGGRLAEENYGTMLQTLPVNYQLYQVTNSISESEIRSRSQDALDTLQQKTGTAPGAVPVPPPAPPRP